MILKDGRIFVYEPDNRLSLEQFVDKYSKAYAKGEIKIPNIVGIWAWLVGKNLPDKEEKRG